MSVLKPYKRLLLKISGEAFMGSLHHPLLDPEKISSLANGIKELHASHDVAVVMGGGNFVRGEKLLGFPRSEADELGMLATVMNGRALRVFLEKVGVPCLLLQAKGNNLYDAHHARQELQKKNVVLCAGGTGSSFVTTDTAAVLRALELNCDVVLKATNVDGVYDADPKQDSKAKVFSTLTYQEALDRRLQVMDQAAFALAKEHSMPIIVFSWQKGFLVSNQRYTLISS